MFNMEKIMPASISKDRLAHFDPAIKDVRVVNGFINLTLEPTTVILTLSEDELHQLTKLLQETNLGL